MCWHMSCDLQLLAHAVGYRVWLQCCTCCFMSPLQPGCPFQKHLHPLPPPDPYDQYSTLSLVPAALISLQYIMTRPAVIQSHVPPHPPPTRGCPRAVAAAAAAAVHVAPTTWLSVSKTVYHDSTCCNTTPRPHPHPPPNPPPPPSLPIGVWCVYRSIAHQDFHLSVHKPAPYM